jgi:hypothetical protein
VGLAAAGAALAGAALAGLSFGGQAQALEQPIHEQIDVGGLACVHLGADIAIPDQPGGRTALALQRLDLAPGACTA